MLEPKVLHFDEECMYSFLKDIIYRQNVEDPKILHDATTFSESTFHENLHTFLLQTGRTGENLYC